jgi:hypothetical protein
LVLLQPVLLFCLRYWGLNSGPTPWATSPALCFDGIFQDRVSKNLLGQALNCNSPVSASWVARITGMSHQVPDRAEGFF